ncbi:MAG: hypothetical protein VYC34_12210 [Planctomycetota bacterium]|nr:hypothetical protein [Planctomycetota bacterium]
MDALIIAAAEPGAAEQAMRAMRLFWGATTLLLLLGLVVVVLTVLRRMRRRHAPKAADSAQGGHPANAWEESGRRMGFMGPTDGTSGAEREHG